MFFYRFDNQPTSGETWLWNRETPQCDLQVAVYAVRGAVVEAPDLAEILIEFKDRCMASVHIEFFQRPRRRQLELIGTQGVILLEFAAGGPIGTQRFRIEVVAVAVGHGI